MTEISLRLLAAADIKQEPFTWGCLEQTFETPDAAECLMREFPSEDFLPLVSRRDSKMYSMSGRSVHSSKEGLTRNWKNFIRSVESDEYRFALGNITGISLEGLERGITLWRYRLGDHLGPHTDKPEKVVTHIIYFSDSDWTVADGGCLDILSSEEPTAVVRRIEPVCGRSVVLVRSDRSWHAVTPQRRDHVDRRAVQVVFHRGALNYSTGLDGEGTSTLR